MAGNIKGITIEFRGDTTKLDKALRQIKTESKSIDSQLRDVNRALKFNPNNVELLKQKFELLKQKVDGTQNELKQFRDIEAQLKANNVSKQSQEWMEVRRNIIEAESKLKYFNSEIAKIKYANVEKLGNAFKSAGQNMRSAGMGASVGAAAMIMSGKKLLELNATQSQAETKLTEIYKSRMGATKEAAQSTIDLAAALQKEGVIGDEVALSGAQQLATYASMPSTVNKLLPAMENLLVQQKGVNATAEDAASIANLFGKAMMGQTGALKRAGISFTEEQEKILKFGTEEEKAAMLAQVVTDNVGNMNQVFAQTDEGKMAQLRNTLGDIGERLGAMLLPKLAELATWFSDKIMPKIEELVSYLEAHPMFAKLAVGITAVLAVAGPLLIFFGALVGAIGTIITAFGALAAAETVALGPILAVVAAIGAAIAAGVLLYKNWDKIKEAAGKLKDWLVDKFTALKDTLKNIVEKIKNFFKFKFALPKIKLPHFSVKPKGWKIGDLLKGSIPSLGISWYKHGGIFNKPSVVGVGEAGPEAVLPIEKLEGMMTSMADSIVNGMLTGMQMMGAGSGGDITIPVYLYPSGAKMGETTVKTYDKYKKILG